MRLRLLRPHGFKLGRQLGELGFALGEHAVRRRVEVQLPDGCTLASIRCCGW